MFVKFCFCKVIFGKNKTTKLIIMENLHKDLEKLLSDSSITEDAKEVIKKLLKDDIERQKRLLEELEKSLKNI